MTSPTERSGNEPTGAPNLPALRHDDGSGDDGCKCPVSRRAFCNGMLLTSAGLVVGPHASSAAAAVQGPEVTGLPMRIEGAEALMPGSSLDFYYPTRNDAAILVRTQDGNFHAYCQKCSHLGCSVYFDRTLGRLECPCHRGAYDAKSGFVLMGPPQRPLDEILLQVRGGQVWAINRLSYRDTITD
jgi:Rieske Fe-S protein